MSVTITTDEIRRTLRSRGHAEGVTPHWAKPDTTPAQPLSARPPRYSIFAVPTDDGRVHCHIVKDGDVMDGPTFRSRQAAQAWIEAQRA